MAVYRKFGPDDIQSSVVHTAPRIMLASSSLGWRSNTGPSSSLSLYGGLRARTDVKNSDYSSSGIAIYPLDLLDTHSIDKVIFVSGSYPASGSIQWVKVRPGPAPSLLSVTPVDWYEEHFRPILNLYDFYSQTNPAYNTSSYDYYSLFLKQNLPYNAEALVFNGAFLREVSSSFSVEAWIKPTEILNSTRDFTIASQGLRWKLYITGSSGKLAFTDYATILTSSAAVNLGIWQRVGFTMGGGTGSLYLGQFVDSSFSYTGSLSASSIPLTAGAEYVLSGTSHSLALDQGFSGMMHELRIWNTARTSVQMSSSWNSPATDPSLSSSLRHYLRLNDGPLGYTHGFTVGSGAYDYGANKVHAQFFNVNTVLPLHPTWLTNDNITFVTPKNLAQGSPQFFRLVHVPSMFYGRQIATGSVQVVDNSYAADGIQRVFVDDGRGGLYLSGSMTKPLNGGSDDCRGVFWNKVGNVFYSEGLIVFTDPTTYDVGDGLNMSSPGQDSISIRFDGDNRIAAKEFSCRIGRGEANASNNPTYSYFDETTQTYQIKQDKPTTYVTAIGLYDKNRRLVALAKMAQPIRKRESDQQTINIKIDL